MTDLWTATVLKVLIAPNICPHIYAEMAYLSGPSEALYIPTGETKVGNSSPHAPVNPCNPPRDLVHIRHIVTVCLYLPFQKTPRGTRDYIRSDKGLVNTKETCTTQNTYILSKETAIRHLKAENRYPQGVQHRPLPHRMDVDAEPQRSGENHHGQPILCYSPPARVHVQQDLLLDVAQLVGDDVRRSGWGIRACCYFVGGCRCVQVWAGGGWEGAGVS